MDPLSSNLLKEKSQPNEPKESRRVIVLLLAALVFLVIAASIGGLLFAAGAGFTPGTIWARLRSLTLAREKMLGGEKEDRVNILLLGMGGAGHEGATLTDTIIFASLRPSDKTIGLLSIPRDLQILLPGYGYQRINAVNAYAELEAPGSGAAAAGSAVARTLDQSIHYYLRVDFKAFEEIVDTIGGIDVNVERSFYDPFFPDDNFGYAPVAFEAGFERMNGKRALQFVRSRHGTAGEGNDFSRARRQQKVLFALKDRLLSFDILLRPKRIKSIVESLADHVQTNIAFWEGMRLANFLREIDNTKIISRVLDDAPDGVLTARNYNGAFVLEPKDETWSEVRAIAAGLLEEPNETPARVSTSPSPQPSPPKGGEGALKESPLPLGEGQGEGTPLTEMLPLVELQNGTLVEGLAARTAERLERQGFNPISIGNAPVRDIETTIVYDLSGGDKPGEFERLKNELKAIEGEGEPLEILRKGELDFLVILGADAAE